MGAAKVKTPKGFFLPYQTRWIKDASTKKLMEKSRQVGLTYATSYRQTVETAMKTARFDCWVSSRDDVQAKLFIEDCKYWLPILKTTARDLGEIIIGDKASLTSRTLEFANGHTLNSLSSNPDAQAGKRGSRVLDEFALHPDPRKLYAIAYPGVTWGGQIEIISTHRGSKNFFNDLVRDAREGGNPKKFSLHRVTLQDALDQGFLGKLQTKLAPDHEVQGMDEAAYFDHIRNSCADVESFLQEYMCVPADDNAAFLTYDEIVACEFAEGLAWDWSVAECTKAENPLYLGVDVGRTHDLTVMWLMESVAGVLLTRHLVVLRNTPFAQQEELLWELLALPGLRRACLDSSGLGRQLAERAIERFGSSRVEAVNFTAPVKEDLAYGLRVRFEKGALRIPSDKHIRADLRAIKKILTTAGNIRFAADRGPGGHADRFWALALAAHAAKGFTCPASLTLID